MPQRGRSSKRSSPPRRAGIWSAVVLAVIAVAFAVRLFGGSDWFSADASSGPVGEQGAVLTVRFLDVGQADSIAVQLPNGRTMVIDAGNNGDGALIADYLESLGIARIDYLIGTHPHEDHIGGLDVLIDSFSIGELYLPRLPEKLTPTTVTYLDVLTAVENKNMKIKTAKAGVTLFEEEPLGLKAELLSPDAGREYSDLNNYSAMVLLTYGSKRFLFTGDAEASAEAVVLDNGFPVSADVLKVGHHGSSTSTSDAFLDAVSPRYAVISCGKDNKFGHPHEETLTKFEDRAIRVYRTDEAQTITALCDGVSLVFETGGPSCDKK